MLFNTFGFLCIIPVILFVYYLPMQLCKSRGNVLLNRVGNTVLLTVSYAFFFYNQPVYTLLLFGVTLITYLFARIFASMQPDASHLRRRRFWLVTAGCVLALLPLALFKYYNFVLDLSEQFLGMLGVARQLPHTSWIVPLGISFFTFQALG